MGPVFRPQGVGIHCFRRLRRDHGEQVFQPFPRGNLPPLQARDAQRHFLGPLNLPECLAESAGLTPQGRPFLAREAVFGHGFEDLGDALPRDRRPPAEPAHLLPLRFRIRRQPREFGVARGDRRQVEAVRFDDLALGVAFAVAFAVRAVLHGDQASLDQGAVHCLDAGGR